MFSNNFFHGYFLFNPAFIFLLGYLYFSILPLIYLNSYDLEVLSLVVLYGAAFFLGYLFKLRFKPLQDTKIKNQLIRFLFKFYLFFFITLILLSFFTFTTSSSYIDKYVYQNELFLYLQVLDKVFILIAFVISALYSSQSFIKYLLVSLGFIFVSFLSETRLDVIFTVLFFVGLGFYLGYFKIRFLYFIVALPILLVFMVFFILKRVSKAEGMGFIDTYRSTFDLLLTSDQLIEVLIVSLESISTFKFFQNVLSDNFIEPLSGYVRIFFMPIPRFIWEEKPESISRILVKQYMPETYEAGGGMIAGPIGDAYINGGVFGVFFIWFVIGLIMRSSYQNLFLRGIRSPSSFQRVYYFSIYFIFLQYFIYSIRGFSSDYLWSFVFYLFLIIFFFKIAKYKIKL